jgi:hypothetical protein
MSLLRLAQIAELAATALLYFIYERRQLIIIVITMPSRARTMQRLLAGSAGREGGGGTGKLSTAGYRVQKALAVVLTHALR